MHIPVRIWLYAVNFININEAVYNQTIQKL